MNTIKKTKLLLVAITLLGINTALGQVCGTVASGSPTVYPRPSASVLSGIVNTPICVNVFFHIINGSSPTSTLNLNRIIDDINFLYARLNISFNNAGSQVINNSNYIMIDNKSEARSLAATYNRPGVINFYIVKELWLRGKGATVGTSIDIPSNNVVIRSDEALKTTAPHELGHALEDRCKRACIRVE